MKQIWKWNGRIRFHEEIPPEDAKGKLYNFLLPIVVLIGVSLFTSDVLLGLVWAIIACGLLYLPTRLINLGEFSHNFMTGFANMIPMLCILVGALAMKTAMDEINLPTYVSGGTFGSHACFYSDVTVLTSQSCGIVNLDHALTQIPYALLSAIIAAGLFLRFGIAMA